MLRLAIALAIVLGLAPAAMAQSMPDVETVGGMRLACKHLLGEGDDPAVGQLLAFECSQHMSNVAHPPGYKMTDKAPVGHCVPDNATAEQMAAAFVRWADAREERWTDDAKAGTADAFREAWPCE